MSVSVRIFDFICNLPQFQHTRVEEKSAAVRFTDGALVFVPANLEEQENGILMICWGSAAGHVSLVSGVRYAQLMIVEAAKYFVATGQHDNLQGKVAELCEHFHYKTGEQIWIEDNAGLTTQVKAVTKIVGNAVLGAIAGKVI